MKSDLRAVLALSLCVMPGCGAVDEPSGDAGPDCGTKDDGGACLDADAGAGGGGAGGGAGGGGAGGETVAPPTVEITWNPDGVTVAIETAATGDAPDAAGDAAWRFGMAETGEENGWYGEDCLDGAFGGYDLCHPLPEAGGFLAHVATPEEVVAGSSTLFTEAIALRGVLTYVLMTTDGEHCWVRGHDAAYYAALGCGALP